MKDIKLEINFKFCTLEELDAADRQLVMQAVEATSNSYSKYSHFSVGAALRLADGEVFKGANQENAAFPSGLCAERTAIFAAQANRPDQPLDTLAIAAKNTDGLVHEPVTPCGACRQVMIEMEDRYQRPLRVLLYGTDGVYIINSVKDLLPLSFVDENMHK